MGKNNSFDDDFFFENISFNIDKNSGDFEDISSNSKKYQIDTDKIDRSFENAGHSYRRKKRGIAKTFDNAKYRIYKWWKCMKKSKKRLTVALTAVVLAVVVFFATGGMKLFYNYKGLKGDIGFNGVIDKDIMNVALFGIDSRDTKGKATFTGNSDSIMILSLNKKSKKIKIISLLRDTFVPIEKEEGVTSYGKINSAYASGGPELAVKTINNIFHLDISEFATVNFYGMADIIEAVGGIDVELTQNEVTARGNNNHGINDMIQEICVYENLNPNDYYVNNWGKQHLNGIQAVAYSRIRYCTNIWGTSNDYGRTDRQRFVMHQLFNSVKNLNKSKYLKLANALIPCTQTSLEPDKIISIGWSMMMDKPEFEEYRIPLTSADADTANGERGADIDFLISPTPSGYGSVIYIDLEYASKVIHAILYEDMTAKGYIAEHPVEKNSWYKGGGYYSGGTGVAQKETPATPQPSTATTSDTASKSKKSSTKTKEETTKPKTETPQNTDDNTTSPETENEGSNTDDTNTGETDKPTDNNPSDNSQDDGGQTGQDNNNASGGTSSGGAE